MVVLDGEVWVLMMVQYIIKVFGMFDVMMDDMILVLFKFDY